MKKIKLNIVILLAIVFGAAAAFGVYQYLNSVKAAYVEQGDYVKIAVAAQHIPGKIKITPQMFTMQEVPSKYVNDDAAVVSDEITGQLTKAPIYPGEQILRSRVSGKDDSSGELAYIIPAGERAVTVAVNEVSGVAGMIRPGDHVDVLVTIEDESNNQGENKGKVLTSTILQKIKILATDRNKSAVTGQGEQEKIYQTVTLSVTPQQAQTLVLASEKGSIRVILRSHADENTVHIPSTRINDLIR